MALFNALDFPLAVSCKNTKSNGCRLLPFSNRISSVPSVDPLSTKITSVGSESENSNPSRLASNLCTLAARLNVGTMTVIQGRSFVLKASCLPKYQ